MKKKRAPTKVKAPVDEHDEKFDVDKDVVVGMFEKLVDDTYTKGKMGTASASEEPCERIKSKLRCLEFSLTGAMNSLMWRLKDNPEDGDENPFKGLRSEIYLLLQGAKWAAQIHEVINNAQRKPTRKKKKQSKE